jgi:DNA repair protein RadD
MVKRADTKLRDYQQDLIDETVEALRDHRSVLLQAPTGAGKTEIAVEIARIERDKVVWFVCHRHEIVAQTSAALKRGGMNSHGVVAPRYPEDPGIKIQVCSIAALHHRLNRYPPPDLIILDECHHVAAPSWAKLVESFPEAKLLGLTATPERLDGRGLKDWFQHMIVGPDTSTLIDEGYLSKFRMFAPTIPDLWGVRVKQKEYDRHDLEGAMNKSTLVGDIVDHFKEKLAPNARALAFCVSVDASRELAARFTKAGIPAKHVDWETPQEKRDEAVADLAGGKIRVLTNREVFTEGLDLPVIDAVLLLRPTKSFALYRQMIGRCLRVAKGKTHTMILDHAGLIFEHGLPDSGVEWSLSGRRSGVAKGYPHGGGFMRRCPECSAVHKWSAKCPECSYVYQIKDRTIEEVYGDLREIAQGAEYESQKRFAQRCRLSRPAIADYVKQKELVTYGPRRLIKIKEGLARVEWLRENDAKYETQDDFAKRIGAERATIVNLIKKGLPNLIKKTLPNFVLRLIPIDAAMQWLRGEGLLTEDGEYIRRRPRSPPGFDSRKSFAKRIDVDPATVSDLIKKGLPVNDVRQIPVEDGLAWLRREGLLTADGEYIRQQPRIRQNPQSTPGFDTQKQFAKRIGVAPLTIHRWIKNGLPTTGESKLIPVEAAMRWVEENPPRRSNPGFDTQTRFAQRVGVREATVDKWIEEGMPINDLKLIPVEAAMRWVEENCQPKKNVTHGHAVGGKHSPEYITWQNMRTRCRNGGRGITVDPRWEQFETFLADMGLRPSLRHRIDRIDKDGNYEPGNCRWVTKIDQTAPYGAGGATSKNP